MTDVEEALLWAREQLATFWEKAPGVRDADRAVHVNNARSGASDGDLEEAVRGRLHWLDGNRAGAPASAERIKELEAALAKADELCRVALPQFNWAASALDGQAVSILNEAPGIIHRAMLKEPDQ